MIVNLALPIIERALSQYLKLDPEMHARIKKYHGKVIRFTISTIEITFYLVIEQENIKVKANNDGPIDASIKASIADLVKNALSDRASISQTMELNGDVALLQAITKIFKNIEIDWEEILSNCTGDTVAHGIGNIVRDIKSFGNELFETKKLNIKEYLQEEINLLTHPYAVEDFCKDVDEFRDEVERLKARIELIAHHDKKN